MKNDNTITLRRNANIPIIVAVIAVTDSFVYQIKTDDFYEDMKGMKEHDDMRVNIQRKADYMMEKIKK